MVQTWILNLGHEFYMQEEVKVFRAGLKSFWDRALIKVTTVPDFTKLAYGDYDTRHGLR